MEIDNAEKIKRLNMEYRVRMNRSGYADKKDVPGEGNPEAKIMLVGEAPGGDEELQGRPFVGKAGKNLDSFLDTLGLLRKDIYISNTVKIRPTAVSPRTGGVINRAPTKEEIEFFIGWLKREIEIINPECIVTLGNTPLKALTDVESATIGRLHGQVLFKREMKIFPLYHPAAIIYKQELEEIYNEDLKKLKKYLEI